MHWILPRLFDAVGLGFPLYVILASLVGLVAVLILHLVLFSIGVLLLKKDDPDFEYALKRQWLKSLLYLFICFLLTAEIIAGWNYGWFGGFIYVMPLFVVFIITAILALVRAWSFMRRSGYAHSLRKGAETEEGVTA